jgi:drug/metabolite transporter (DMT)-like permease
MIAVAGPVLPSGVSRVYRLIVLVTLLKPFSNVFLAWGMQRAPAMAATHPLHLLLALLDPLVITGVLLQIGWLLLRMSLLSVADLSYVLPVTAAGYVISTFLGWVVLHEEVSLTRWIGSILISVGAALVVSTPRITSEPAQ